jgi:hypothetical protein
MPGRQEWNRLNLESLINMARNKLSQGLSKGIKEVRSNYLIQPLKLERSIKLLENRGFSVDKIPGGYEIMIVGDLFQLV